MEHVCPIPTESNAYYGVDPEPLELQLLELAKTNVISP